MKKAIPALLLFTLCFSAIAQQSYIVESPDKKIRVECGIDPERRPYYTIHYNDSLILEPSRLGFVTEEADLTKDFAFFSASRTRRYSDKYTLVNSKRLKNSYEANLKHFHFRNSAQKSLHVTFRVYNDGVALIYGFGNTKIDREVTSFKFPANTKAWLQPMSKAKSGWEKVNPCYEEFYEKGIPAGKPASLGAGWVYPALFQTGNTWVLISEGGVYENWCASKLENEPGT